MTKITAIVCPKCKDTIYSRALHDMRWCTCRSIAIDGGFDYLKVSMKDSDEIENKMQQRNLTVSASKRQLYDDWDQGIDRYGLIKGKSGKK